MEEKERFELFGEFGIIHDTSPNAECMLLNKFQTCEILNRQDKENQQLKQQLRNLPKKIMEEIKGKQPNFTENSYGFTTRQGWDMCVEILDTILKKYGEEK